MSEQSVAVYCAWGHKRTPVPATTETYQEHIKIKFICTTCGRAAQYRPENWQSIADMLAAKSVTSVSIKDLATINRWHRT